MFFHKILAIANNCFSSSSSSHSSIQAVYDLCKRSLTPSASPPPSTTINQLSSLLDKIDPTSVGLIAENQEDDANSCREGRYAQPITYIELIENTNFTMCMFCFPKSSVIPLHDHPDMTVLSKVLYGSLHVKAYDWVEPPQIKERTKISQSTVRLAKLAINEVFKAPCNTSILYPKTGGNIHCFTAVTPCAVFDILTPPYDETVGRKCSYYRDHPYSTFRSEGDRIDGKEEEYVWLEEIETPDDFYMHEGRYAGPPIEI